VTYATATSYCPGTYTKPEQVVTVTVKDYTTYCPFAGVTPTTTPAPVTTTSKPPPPPPKPTSTTAAAAPSAPASGSNASSKSSAASIGGSTDHYGMTYTPYESSNGACKSAAEVLADLTLIKSQGFKAIRTYSASDCNTLQNVGGAAEMLGLDMIVGIFISDTGCTSSSPDVAEQIEALASWTKWDIVKLFTIGNEAIGDGYCTASELATLISEVKSKCSSYTGPYSTVETVNIWQESEVASSLCSLIDLVGSNVHPFFNSDTTPATAGSFVQSEIKILEAICEGLSAVVTETGWPTAGDCNGEACPGESEQSEALQNLRSAVGSNSFFFSFENDYWKESGAFDCENSWGVKPYFASLLEELGL
jgi:exo-beta-1,3-glucanase (GH17 family)